MSRAQIVVAALLMAALASGCRNSGGAAADAGTGDMEVVLLNCATTADCLTCCAGTFESGALDYDSSLMACACTPQSCLGACGSSVCGSALGVDGPCRACLAIANSDGGVCQQATSDCEISAGPCASFADCVAACPN